jgi:arsenate reductase
VTGTPDEQHRAFMDAAITIKRRIELMLALPMHKLDALSLHQHVRDIGAQ